MDAATALEQLAALDEQAGDNFDGENSPMSVEAYEYITRAVSAYPDALEALKLARLGVSPSMDLIDRIGGTRRAL